MKVRLPFVLRLLLNSLESIENTARSLRRSTHHLRVAIMSEALSDEERYQISIDAYHQSLGPEKADDDLFDWEQAWFERNLPATPARVLVAAAGSGRESVALEHRGYGIDALEPAEGPAATCIRRLDKKSRVVQASFSDLSATVLDGRETPVTALATHYDAVILGWGGLTHVLRHEDRLRLMRSCDKLAPQGPILASFFMDPHAVDRQQTGWLPGLGRCLGRAIARARSIPGCREPVEYTSWGGFLRHFTPSEIDELGEVINRKVQWQREGGFPHVTFLAPEYR